jgi:hypothetical protein
VVIVCVICVCVCMSGVSACVVSLGCVFSVIVRVVCVW